MSIETGDGRVGPKRGTVAAVLLAAVPMIALALAGLVKLADLPAFADALRTWRHLPPWSIPLVLHALPIAEVAVGGGWIIGMRRGLCVRAALFLLGAVTAAFGVQWLLGAPSQCGCLGAIGKAVPAMEQPAAILWRNVVLMLMLTGAIFAAPSPRLVRARRIPNAIRSAGFTLIEVVLSVVLVGLLIALMAPSLASIRQKARGTVSLSNLRQHAAVLAAYAADHADYFPSVTMPGATYTVLRCHSAGIARPSGYFEASWAWHIELADAYYDGRVFSPAFKSPLMQPRDPTSLHNSYQMACSMLADADYYDPATRSPPPDQWRGIRVAEVVFPSDKVLLVDAWPRSWHVPAGTLRRLCANVDGSAEEVPFARFGPQMTTGDGVQTRFLGGHASGSIWPLQHTLRGVRGRDILR